MAEISDELLKNLVETCKKKRLERTASELTKDREGRVYVNRSISMDRIKYIGFDMDHTLVVYKSPEYDILAYDLTVDRLIATGYPKSIKDIKYDPSFAIRGLFFDRKYGNLLKLDSFGNILSCCHGFSILSPSEIRKCYPNKYIQPANVRLFNMDTLYHYCETFLLAGLVNFFENNSEYTKLEEDGNCIGVQNGDIVVTYQMIQQDVRNAVNWAHVDGDIKKLTLENLPKYVKIDARLASFVKRLCESGRKLFIATNSGYAYTMKIMSYIFENACNPLTEPNEWKKYFDFIIVNANKPLFFQEGSMLREIDESTGSLRLGRFTGDLKKGKVFSGGSSEAFNKIAGVQGKEVLYVGDHIFGDIIKSKKEQAFRTFLVIPELTVEMKTWENTKSLLLRMQSLEFLMAEIYRINESQAQSPVNLPDINIIRKCIRETAGTIEGTYPHTLGGLLRCGSRLTYFANQVSRFADLYSATCVNLVNYPTHYLFSSPHQLMAHESALTETDDDTSKLLNQKPPLRKSMSSYVTAFDLDEEDSDEPQNGMMENISED